MNIRIVLLTLFSLFITYFVNKLIIEIISLKTIQKI